MAEAVLDVEYAPLGAAVLWGNLAAAEIKPLMKYLRSELVVAPTVPQREDASLIEAVL
jgi:hypothetical protein